MKHPLLIILLLFTSGLLLAQDGLLRVEPGNVVKEVVLDDLDEDYQDITNVTVTNTSRRTIQLVQSQLIGKKPRSWKYGTFSRKKVSSPYVMSEAEMEVGRPVRLNPGQSASFFVVLQPDGISGEGTMEVRFSDLTVPGRVLAAATFTTKILRRPRLDAGNPPDLTPATTIDTGRPVPTSVNLYPNPARDRFFVEAPPGTQLGRIEVSNTLGKRLRQFSGKPGPNGFEIEDLPDGLYLISVYDSHGKKLKTLRLLHRRFGA